MHFTHGNPFLHSQVNYYPIFPRWLSPGYRLLHRRLILTLEDAIAKVLPKNDAVIPSSSDNYSVMQTTTDNDSYVLTEDATRCAYELSSSMRNARAWRGSNQHSCQPGRS